MPAAILIAREDFSYAAILGNLRGQRENAVMESMDDCKVSGYWELRWEFRVS